MLKAIKLIVGLPGSGKTTWGASFIQQNPKTLFIDDISIVTDNAKECLSKIAKDYEYILISDVYFCQEEVRTVAIETINKVFSDIPIETIYFENSIEKCLNNISKREKEGDQRKVLGLIKELSKKYKIPENVNQITIHQNKPKLKN